MTKRPKTELGKQKILSFIKKYFIKHGYAPSYREINEGVGYYSTNTANRLVREMVAEGTLETELDNGDGKLSPRGIRVANQSVTFWTYAADEEPIPFTMYELIFKIGEHVYQCHAYHDGSDWYARNHAFMPGYDVEQDTKIKGAIAIAYAEVPKLVER